jgi:hypothetical protein
VPGLATIHILLGPSTITGLPIMPILIIVFIFGYPHHLNNSVIHIILVIYIVRLFTVIITYYKFKLAIKEKKISQRKSDYIIA